MRKIAKRAFRVIVVAALAMGLTATPSSARTIGQFGATHPESISCSTKSCRAAKAWYGDYVGFATSFLVRGLDDESLHNMRKMAAMSTGGSVHAPGSVERLKNVDILLVEANRSRTARACAAQALFFAGDQARQNKAVVKEARAAFSIMKKITKRYPTLKAYANLGYESVDIAEAINQLKILQALQNNLRSCV